MKGISAISLHSSVRIGTCLSRRFSGQGHRGVGKIGQRYQHQYGSLSIVPPCQSFTGNGGGGGGFVGGGGGDWGDDPEEGGSNRFDILSFIFGIVCLALPSVLVLKYKESREDKTLKGYDIDPVQSLKRLVRELFEKDVDLQSRLSEVEHRLGIVHDAQSPGLNASRVSSSGHDQTNRLAAPRDPSSTSGMLRSVGGRLTLGGGFLWSDIREESNLDAVVDTGVQLGTVLTLQSRGQCRGGKDFIVADVDIDGGSQEQFNLQKVLYSCGVSEHLRLMFAPFGARGNDVTYTLNPFAGRGLTAGTSEGIPLLHSRGRGSVIGGTLSSSRIWTTGAFFRNEEDSAEKALVQVIAAPTKQFSVGVSLLEVQGQESSKIVQYADMLLNSILRRNSDSTRSQPASQALELGANFALSVGNDFAIHGWAVTDSPDKLISNTTIWNLSFGDKVRNSDGASMIPRWVASIGKTSRNTTDTSQSMIPDTLEFSTEFDLGNGFTCHPGMVAVRDQNDTWTVLAGAKAVWDF